MANPCSIFGPRTPPLFPGTGFDAHCHVFTVDYLFLEAGQMLADWLAGNYPDQTVPSARSVAGVAPMALPPGAVGASPSARASGAPGSDIGGQIELFLSWLGELLVAAFGSEAENERFLVKTMKKTWGLSDAAIIPLMMDIYYMYAPPLNASAPGARMRSATPKISMATGPRPSPRVREPLNAATREEFRNRLSQALSRGNAKATNAKNESRGMMSSVPGGEVGTSSKNIPFPTVKVLGKTHKSSESLAEWLLEIAENIDRSRLPPEFKNVELSAGYAHQLVEILSLKKRKGNTTYPFLAVDPRRTGIMEAAMSGTLVGPGCPFAGIKLYPRLGVDPRCGELAPLFEYCAEHSIPMTAHASYEGFPDFMNTYAQFGSPENYRAVMTAHPDLKLDLAHFGDRDEGEDWALMIADMMDEFPGLHSDLSCYTKPEKLDAFIARFYGRDSVRQRTMYGSDFDVMYFTNAGKVDLDIYQKSFSDRFTSYQLAMMANGIPMKFLGIG